MADTNGVLANTMQSQVHLDEVSDLGLLPMFLQVNSGLPAWWSKSRDIELARFWPKIDHIASAFSMFLSKTASIPVKIVPKDVSIKAHDKQAEYYNSIILSGSDFGKGWHASLGPKFIIDFITQDNGAFIEVIGDAPMVRDPITQKLRKDYSKPIVGPVLGFAHLDSQRCQRTSNPEYPVIFEAVDGSRYRLHHTRVIFAASMPSSRTKMNGVGLCALSRMLSTAQHLLDISTMEQEELGSRPKRRLIIGKKGVSHGEIVSAFRAADIQMDNEGLSRYSKSIVLAPQDKRTANNEIEIDVKDLNLALKGGDKEMSITLGMFLIALALNIPPRWLWPATSTGNRNRRRCINGAFLQGNG